MAKFKPRSKVGTQQNQMTPENGLSHIMRVKHYINIQSHYRSLNPSGDIINSNFWSRLIVREAARTQSFPDKF